MKTVGIDLASADSRTGVVRISWDGEGRGAIEDRDIAQPASDDLIAEFAVGCTSIAIDAPLGWPTGFVDALVAHRSHQPWPDLPDSHLRLRETDRRLGLEHVWPLSVSTDRIGIVAFRAARLLPRLGRGPAPARDGSAGIFEVYPAAALWRWRQQHRAYKRSEGAHLATRTAILTWLSATYGLEVAAVRARVIASSDLLDATICAVLARDGAMGRLQGPPSEDRELAREEGWIHLPAADR